MPLIFDHAQVPPGGYSFPDPSGVVLRSDGLKPLLGKIAQFRSTNGFPPGNPALEVEAYCLIHHPWLVTKVGAVSPVTEDPVARWINRLWLTPPKEHAFTESVIQDERLAVCAQCPHYVPSHPYSLQSRRRLTILGVGHIKDFGACKAHHWPVGLAALISSPGGEPVSGVDCWGSGIMPA